MRFSKNKIFKCVIFLFGILIFVFELISCFATWYFEDYQNKTENLRGYTIDGNTQQWSKDLNPNLQSLYIAETILLSISIIRLGVKIGGKKIKKILPISSLLVFLLNTVALFYFLSHPSAEKQDYQQQNKPCSPSCNNFSGSGTQQFGPGLAWNLLIFATIFSLIQFILFAIYTRFAKRLGYDKV